MTQARVEYLSAGANRHPSAADWSQDGVLAFGADRNIALWEPENPDSFGVFALLSGHEDIVNTVKFLPNSDNILLSGGVDKTVRIWKKDAATSYYSCIQTLSDHQTSINCIAVSQQPSKIFVSGSADATLKVWSLDDQNVASLRQSIDISPRFFPLAIALHELPGAPESYVLAVAGTKDIIQLYVCDSSKSPDFRLQATLSGHEGWIRSLEFVKETTDSNSDLLLSSASQDKYIRLWRLHQGKNLPAASASQDPSLGAFMPGKSLSNKAHRFQAQGLDYSATFEALLLGHEDWIYSAKWLTTPPSASSTEDNKTSTLQLLSASADNSLAIWSPDPTTGVWITTTRLGEISAEKGSTTATGSTGGFWSGLYSPSGKTVISLGRTGSFRLWNYSPSTSRWIQGIGISGHTQSITGISWSPDGTYILSTSSDQTTRLHAPWIRSENKKSWHEMARPQIHGYDINCISSLTPTKFVSGADEKLLRVFEEPKGVAKILQSLCGINRSEGEMESLPDAANMPVLGLSNKAIETTSSSPENQEGTALTKEEEFMQNPHGTSSKPSYPLPSSSSTTPQTPPPTTTTSITKPPTEDTLTRLTLFPELEKLYGHGYEISSLTTSPSSNLIATACKATSLSHAVIRLYSTSTYQQVLPPLEAHSLTVTRLRFSSDEKWLISVGRDRRWVVWSKKVGDGEEGYEVRENRERAHGRMILDCSFAPLSPLNKNVVFATAGRDKSVKIWSNENPDDQGEGWNLKSTIVEKVSITAVDFLDVVVGDGGKGVLAVGMEDGEVKIYFIGLNGGYETKEIEVGWPGKHTKFLRPITQLAWKPTNKIIAVEENGQTRKKAYELAIASEDSSLRIYSLEIDFSVARVEVAEEVAKVIDGIEGVKVSEVEAVKEGAA